MKLIDKIREKFGIEEETSNRVESNYIVAYCRRSEKDSTSRSQSVSVQEKDIKKWAEENGYRIKKSFLIDGESSKRGSKRPSIDKLMDYCRDKSNNISNVVVFHTERFGRDGKYLVDVLDQLIDLGIGFIDIDDSQDVFTPQGRLNQIMKFFKAEIDNEKRKKYIHVNIQEKLLNGYKMGGFVLGYTTKEIKGEKVCVINDDGRILKTAFELKLKGMANTEIVRHLEAMGLTVSTSALGKIFQNPFYCGLVRDVRNPAPRGISKGIHEPIISMRDFCRVNDIINPNRTKLKKTDRPEIPLRRHLVCSGCGNNMTGEYKKKNEIGYYRCNKGCRINSNADKIHDQYLELLKRLTISKKCIPMLDSQLRAFLLIVENENNKQIKVFQTRITELKRKKENVFNQMVEEDDIEMRGEYKQLIKDLNIGIENVQKTISNYERENKGLNHELWDAMEFASKIHQIWEGGSLDVRLKIQSLLFPKGVFYDKKSNLLKPVEINPIVDVMGFLGGNDFNGGENDKPRNPEDVFRLGRTSGEIISNPHGMGDSGGFDDEVLEAESAENEGVALSLVRSNRYREISLDKWLDLLEGIRDFMIYLNRKS